MRRYLALLCLLTGCASAPFRMASYSDEEMAELHVIDLCSHYSGHDGFDEKIKREHKSPREFHKERVGSD